MSARRIVVYLLGGAVFGAGLAYSGLTRQETVLDFLQLEDLGLAVTMMAALAVSTPVYQLAPRFLAHPVLRGTFEHVPPTVRSNHVIGAVVFGVGWGLSGVCPGAALASLATGNVRVLWALVGMLVGAYLQGWIVEYGVSHFPPTSRAKLEESD